jgi:hypothetical protein
MGSNTGPFEYEGCTLTVELLGHQGFYVVYIKYGRAVAQTVCRRLVTRRPLSAPMAVNVGFVARKLAVTQVSFRDLFFSPVSIIPPLLLVHSCTVWGAGVAQAV